ncbi:hypothetical protein TB2_029251 [Malus domestica]
MLLNPPSSAAALCSFDTNSLTCIKAFFSFHACFALVPYSSSALLLGAVVTQVMLRSSLLETGLDPTRIMTMIKLQKQKMNTELEAA